MSYYTKRLHWSFPVVKSMNLGSIPQYVCSNNLIPPPLCNRWIRHEGGTENKASCTKAEATIKQRRGCLCKNARLSHCPSECLLVPLSQPGSFFFFFGSGVCSGPVPISPPEQGCTGRLAGWLAAQERKRPLSNGRWRTACAYAAETHTTHKCAILRIFHAANTFLKL